MCAVLAVFHELSIPIIYHALAHPMPSPLTVQFKVFCQKIKQQRDWLSDISPTTKRTSFPALIGDLCHLKHYISIEEVRCDHSACAKQNK